MIPVKSIEYMSREMASEVAKRWPGYVLGWLGGESDAEGDWLKTVVVRANFIPDHRNTLVLRGKMPEAAPDAIRDMLLDQIRWMMDNEKTVPIEHLTWEEEPEQ